jgi:hypothetical protein
MNHPSQGIFGYSWGVYAAKWRDGDTAGGGVRRFHVCTNCAKPEDQPDVLIRQVPRNPEHRPKCYRCGIPLGMSAV